MYEDEVDRLRHKLASAHEQIRNLEKKNKAASTKEVAELRRHADHLRGNVSSALAKQANAERKEADAVRALADVHECLASAIGYDYHDALKLAQRLVAMHVADVDRIHDLEEQVQKLGAALAGSRRWEVA